MNRTEQAGGRLKDEEGLGLVYHKHMESVTKWVTNFIEKVRDRSKGEKGLVPGVNYKYVEGNAAKKFHDI